jgi:DNA-binding phage protein
MAARTRQEPDAFVRELEAMRRRTQQRVRSEHPGRLHFGDPQMPPSERPEVAMMLKLLQYPEQRVPDVLAARLPAIPDVDIRDGVAIQILEEITHAQLLRDMLKGWGHDPDEGWSHPVAELVHIFDYIESLTTLAEFFSTFLIGEGLFLSTYLEDMRAADPNAFSPYLEAALADEPGHITLARGAVRRYATTAEVQEKTRASAETLLRMFLGGYQARVARMGTVLCRPS